MTLDGRDKVPNQFKPSKITIAMFLTSFLLMGFISWRAVEVSNHGREEARSDLKEANIRIEELQRQLDCISNISLKALRGQVGNSIVQDDLLLASTSGADRAKIAEDLKKSRADLAVITQQIAEADKECVK